MPVVVEDVGDRGRKCDSTAKGCTNKFPWLSQVRQKENLKTLHPAPYATTPYTTTPYRVLSISRLKTPRSSVSIRLYTTQSCDLFRYVPLLFRRSTSVRLCAAGTLAPRQNSTTSKQQQSLPLHICHDRDRRNAWSFAVLSFPAGSKL